MAKQWQIRRGTTQENEEFIGALAEVTYDTEKKTVRVHDGITAGGTELAKAEYLYHPNLFDVKWADHILNDIQWLRADTFSWQSGEVYEAAYNHLSNEYTPEELATITVNDNVYVRSAEDDDLNAIHPYCWKNDELLVNVKIFTTNEEPIVGDFTFGTSTAVIEDSPITALGTITILSTETIADITISYYRTADKHKIVLPDQELNVEAIYEATGIAWYYILDTENQRFKLPRTKFAFTGIRNNAGNYIEPGLPNITGAILDTGSGGEISYQTGALYSATIPSSHRVTHVNDDSSIVGIGIDASRSSSIYGNSTTVQSPATQMYLYFYMGEFTGLALENPQDLVHKSGNETISGVKTFNNKVVFTDEITGRFRTASCHQGADNTNCWFKLGSFSSYGIYHNQIVIFRLWSAIAGNVGTAYGKIITRTGGDGTAGTVNYAKIEFDTCPDWLPKDNFKVLYKESQGTNPDIYGLIELWVKTPNAHTGFCMSIQDERTSAEVYNTSWTFYNLPTGVASLPSGYTQSAPTYTPNRQFGINTASAISRSLNTEYTATRNCWIYHNENENNNSIFYIDGQAVYETDWHSGVTFAKGSALIFVAKGQRWKATGGSYVKEFGTLTGD